MNIEWCYPIPKVIIDYFVHNLRKKMFEQVEYILNFSPLEFVEHARDLEFLLKFAFSFGGMFESDIMWKGK